MKEDLYYVSGSGQPKFLGRDKEIGRVRSSVFRSIPTHVSITGPKFIGKSMLMKNISSDALCEEHGYIGSIYWDIVDEVPKSDDEFLAAFYDKVRSVFISTNHSLAEVMDPLESIKNEPVQIHDTLQTVLQELADTGKRLLCLFDSFDSLFEKSSITHGLLNNLRALTSLRSIVFVIASRKPLLELSPDSNIDSSLFFSLFDNEGMVLGVFSPSDDWESIVEPLEEMGQKIEGNFKNGIFEESGGHPMLIGMILQKITEKNSPQLNSTLVKEVADDVIKSNPPFLTKIWRKFDNAEKDILIPLSKNQQPLDYMKADFRRLEHFGFINETRDKIQISSRILASYIKDNTTHSASVKEVFDDPETYAERIKEVLTRKLERIGGLDQRLKKYAVNQINALAEDPDLVVEKVIRIISEVIKLLEEKVLDRLFPEGKVLADQREFFKNKDPKPSGKFHFLEKVFFKGSPIPKDEDSIVNLLDYLTGNKNITPREISSNIGDIKISKSTALLIQNIWAIRNPAAHPKDYTFPINFAVSVCFQTLALCENLSKELK